MIDESIVAVVQTYLRALAEGGLAVRFGVLFGSWATGTAHEWSDIDLLVVSPRFDGACDRRDVDFLWRTTVHTDNRIEPIPCGEKQWREDDSSAIVELARRQGQVVKPDGTGGWHLQAESRPAAAGRGGACGCSIPLSNQHPQPTLRSG